MKHSLDDTIAAIATPAGSSGVGVIRISGQASLAILQAIFSPTTNKKPFESRRLYHGWIVDPEQSRGVDMVLACYMKGPATYTGEDVVEVSAHGGTVNLERILNVTLKSGARLAERGEFTLRAFLNGKIDLIMAEATIDLISAKTRYGAALAAGNLAGRLSASINNIRSRLMYLLSEIEARIDFPDDFDGLSVPGASGEVNSVRDEIRAILDASHASRLARDGVRVAIIGRPNVGKSTLLNSIIGEERAIVADLPGTTRDTIEENIELNGLGLTFVDTAGLREPTDQVETHGVNRARREIEKANLVLLVLDTSEKLQLEDLSIMASLSSANWIAALNKIDLRKSIAFNGELSGRPAFGVSARHGAGVKELLSGIYDFVVADKNMEGGSLNYINDRQKGLLLRADGDLSISAETLRRGLPLDLAAIDLRAAIVALGEVAGQGVSDEVINEIFSRFCVGK